MSIKLQPEINQLCTVGYLTFNMKDVKAVSLTYPRYNPKYGPKELDTPNGYKILFYNEIPTLEVTDYTRMDYSNLEFLSRDEFMTKWQNYLKQLQ